jgi:hypothetical protein
MSAVQGVNALPSKIKPCFKIRGGELTSGLATGTPSTLRARAKKTSFALSIGLESDGWNSKGMEPVGKE